MLINLTQNKILHCLLSQTGLMHMKAELVYSYSGNRTSSSKELTMTEAAALISYLKSIPHLTPGPSPKGEGSKEACNQMRRKIIAKAHKMRWESPSPLKGGTPKVDMQRIENWCLQYGGFKKKLNEHSYSELVQLVTRFDNMYRKFVASF